VRFADGVAALASAGATVFLEIGPHPVLSALAQQSLTGGEVLVASLKRGRDDFESIAAALPKLAAAGVELDLAGFDAGYPRRRTRVPSYPFDRRSYWFDGALDDAPAAHAERPRGPAGPEAPAAAPPAITAATVKASEASERRALLHALLVEEIARSLEVDPAAIDPRARLDEVGLDSVMVLDVRHGVEDRLDLELPLVDMADAPTVEQLVDRLEDIVSGREPVGPPTEVA
jgi:acyl transferase domain-containing protein